MDKKHDKIRSMKDVAIGTFYIAMTITLIVSASVFWSTDWEGAAEDINDAIETAAEITTCVVDIGDTIHYKGVCTPELKAAVVKNIQDIKYTLIIPKPGNVQNYILTPPGLRE